MSNWFPKCSFEYDKNYAYSIKSTYYSKIIHVMKEDADKIFLINRDVFCSKI